MEKNNKEKTIIGFDYVGEAETKDILDMDVEKTLEYLLWVSRKEEYQNMKDFRKHLTNILKWVHENNMRTIDNCINNHITVDHVEII